MNTPEHKEHQVDEFRYIVEVHDGPDHVLSSKYILADIALEVARKDKRENPTLRVAVEVTFES